MTVKLGELIERVQIEIEKDEKKRQEIIPKEWEMEWKKMKPKHEPKPTHQISKQQQEHQAQLQSLLTKMMDIRLVLEQVYK